MNARLACQGPKYSPIITAQYQPSHTWIDNNPLCVISISLSFGRLYSGWPVENIFTKIEISQMTQLCVIIILLYILYYMFRKSAVPEFCLWERVETLTLSQIGQIWKHLGKNMKHFFKWKYNYWIELKTLWQK